MTGLMYFYNDRIITKHLSNCFIKDKNPCDCRVNSEEKDDYFFNGSCYKRREGSYTSLYSRCLHYQNDEEEVQKTSLLLRGNEQGCEISRRLPPKQRQSLMGRGDVFGF